MTFSKHLLSITALILLHGSLIGCGNNNKSVVIKPSEEFIAQEKEQIKAIEAERLAEGNVE